MKLKSVQQRAQALLTLVEVLVERPGLTWIDANNAVYRPGGPFAILFPAKADRIAYGKTDEGRQIDELIASLPEPAVRPEVEILDSKFMVPISGFSAEGPTEDKNF